MENLIGKSNENNEFKLIYKGTGTFQVDVTGYSEVYLLGQFATGPYYSAWTYMPLYIFRQNFNYLKNSNNNIVTIQSYSNQYCELLYKFANNKDYVNVNTDYNMVIYAR